MEEISLKGESYIKGSILADKYGYTSDYIGQLCRSNQVKATLVGRSWYVNEESLLRHKKGRYRSTLAKSKEMVRKMAEERVQAQRPVNVHKIVRYETDESDLFPTTAREREVVEISEQLVPEIEEVEKIEEMPEEDSVPVEVDVSEERPVPIRRQYRRPIVRTIPAYSVSDRITVSSSKRPQSGGGYVNNKSEISHQSSFSLVPALMTAFLIGEILLVSAALGLEKKLSVSGHTQESIMYDFEPQLVGAAIKSLLE